MTTVCAVQARMGSTRLPGKVLQELGGLPMLAFLLRRLRPLAVDALVVATSTLSIDDPIAALAVAEGVSVVRGDERDVLARFTDVLAFAPADTLVRVTGDCPLTDPALVSDVLAVHDSEHADYTSNVHPRTYPKGLDVEVVRAEALLAAAAHATDPVEREHVTPHLYRHPERYRIANAWNDERLGDEWWTVDTGDDLARLRQIVARLDDPLSASWRDVLAVAPPRRPGGIEVRPTTRAAGEAAARRLGVPWAMEVEVLVDGQRRGVASVGVEAAVAVIEAHADGAVEPVVEAVLTMLRAGVQVDRYRLVGGPVLSLR